MMLKKQLINLLVTEISTVELNYKLFRFFGPTKTITAPVVLDQDIEYYQNDFNDTHSNFRSSF
ncbi:hypothetical protein [Clostridium sp.]|uniref:hypothetical protein n=1 Tax=Clostridium sp. TaxID=1506 RepID=UPI0035222B69